MQVHNFPSNLPLSLSLTRAAAGLRNVEVLIQECIDKLKLPWTNDRDVYNSVYPNENRILLVRYIELMCDKDLNVTRWSSNLCRLLIDQSCWVKVRLCSLHYEWTEERWICLGQHLLRIPRQLLILVELVLRGKGVKGDLLSKLTFAFRRWFGNRQAEFKKDTFPKLVARARPGEEDGCGIARLVLLAHRMGVRMAHAEPPVTDQVQRFVYFKTYDWILQLSQTMWDEGTMPTIDNPDASYQMEDLSIHPEDPGELQQAMDEAGVGAHADQATE
jgi:hypothetical protein